MGAPRGTTNGNARGSSSDRAARRGYLLATYRADFDAYLVVVGLEVMLGPCERDNGVGFKACRCYRCGELLIEIPDDSTLPPELAKRHRLTVDRIMPGARGGTYRRTNIRPACGFCNSATGADVRMNR